MEVGNSLTFVGSGSYWRVEPSPDYVTNVFQGELYAVEFVELCRNSDVFASVLSHIHNSMIEFGDDHGLSVGFWKGIQAAI